jgi:hypothetical protein
VELVEEIGKDIGFAGKVRLASIHLVYTILWWLPPKSVSVFFNSGLKGLRGLKVGVSCVVLLRCPPGLFDGLFLCVVVWGRVLGFLVGFLGVLFRVVF